MRCIRKAPSVLSRQIYRVSVDMASRETQTDRGIIRRARTDEAPKLTAPSRRSKGYWGYDGAFVSACEKELSVSEAELAHNPAYVIDSSGGIIGF